MTDYPARLAQRLAIVRDTAPLADQTLTDSLTVAIQRATALKQSRLAERLSVILSSLGASH